MRKHDCMFNHAGQSEYRSQVGNGVFSQHAQNRLSALRLCIYAKQSKKPTEEHLQAVVKVVRYTFATTTTGICFVKK